MELIGRTKQRILAQMTKDKNRPYALHAPEVECLAKGKARTPYEFGVKVSITTTHKEGLVVGMCSMPGNPYDGHTLAEALEQATILCDAAQEVAIADRGYKGVAVDGVKIYHPGLKRGITREPRAMIKQRSAIEPAIRHMKTDGKLDRNWLKGAPGDAMHASHACVLHRMYGVQSDHAFRRRPWSNRMSVHEQGQATIAQHSPFPRAVPDAAVRRPVQEQAPRRQKENPPANPKISAHYPTAPSRSDTANREPIMAKGQMRSNREVKKPKQAKKPTPATTPSGAPPIRVAPTVSATPKKH